MNWKLLALGKGFKKNWRDVAVPESFPSCSELFIHFLVFFSRELNNVFGTYAAFKTIPGEENPSFNHSSIKSIKRQE